MNLIKPLGVMTNLYEIKRIEEHVKEMRGCNQQNIVCGKLHRIKKSNFSNRKIVRKRKKTWRAIL